MINVAIAGIGFMGMIHYLAYQRVRGVRVVAIASRSEKKRAGDWRGIKGNFGPEGTRMDLAGVTAYADYNRLIADENIDLVDLCLPPDRHRDATLHALAAGKHVFCEKPMALTTADCRRMVDAARRADRQLLIGHVLPLFPEYAHVYKLATSGRYGRVLGGSFKRVISDPLWLKNFYDPRRVGGPLVDLHVHDAHFIRLLMGMPVAVASVGRMRGEVVEYCNSQFHFDDPRLVVTATSGVINQQGRPFTHGFEIHLQRATLHYELAILGERTELMPLKVLTDKGRVIHPKLGDGDPLRAFEAEIKEVVRSIRSGRPSAILGGELARDAITLCHKQTRAVKTRRVVKV